MQFSKYNRSIFLLNIMTKTKELEVKIKDCKTHRELKALWETRRNDKGKVVWPKGKLMEFLIAKAFELESREDKPVFVTYPYGVREQHNMELEQIDGAVHVNGLHALIECKDYKDSKIEISPLVKLRFRLQVRHSSAFGIFFSCTEMTDPAEYWIQFMAPQLIIFWNKEDLEFCLDNSCFVDCLETKYRMAIDKRDYNFNYHQSKKILEECIPLF